MNNAIKVLAEKLKRQGITSEMIEPLLKGQGKIKKFLLRTDIVLVIQEPLKFFMK
jgi:hypothetical protein